MVFNTAVVPPPVNPPFGTVPSTVPPTYGSGKDVREYLNVIPYVDPIFTKPVAVNVTGDVLQVTLVLLLKPPIEGQTKQPPGPDKLILLVEEQLLLPVTVTR